MRRPNLEHEHVHTPRPSDADSGALPFKAGTTRMLHHICCGCTSRIEDKDSLNTGIIFKPKALRGFQSPVLVEYKPINRVRHCFQLAVYNDSSVHGALRPDGALRACKNASGFVVYRLACL